MAFKKAKKVDIYYTPAGQDRSSREEIITPTVTGGLETMKRLKKEGAIEIVMYVHFGEDHPDNCQYNFDDNGKIRKHTEC